MTAAEWEPFHTPHELRIEFSDADPNRRRRDPLLDTPSEPHPILDRLMEQALLRLITLAEGGTQQWGPDAGMRKGKHGESRMLLAGADTYTVDQLAWDCERYRPCAGRKYAVSFIGCSKKPPRRVNGRGHDTEGASSMQLDLTTVEIPLHGRDGSIRAYAIVDAHRADELLSYHWSLSGKYVQRASRENGRWVPVSLHRHVLGLERGDRRVVDHINRNPLDNRECNLRIVTRGENQQNRASMNQRGTSRYRGVYWMARRQKWGAEFMLNRRTRYLGQFDSEEEAAKAVAAARAAHMPFSEEAMK